MQMGRKGFLAHRRLILAAGIFAVALLTGGILFAATNQQTAGTSPVYYVSSSAGDFDIWSVVSGGKPVRMPWNARGIPDVDPAVSQDGRWLAFSSKRTGDYEIWAVDLQAGTKAKPFRITTSTSSDRNPTWSPDASQIAYETDAYGAEEIMIAPRKGCGRLTKGCPTRVTINKDRDVQPAWAPDGRSIAFASQRKGDAALQVYTMSPTGASVRRLTSEKVASSQPSWSPNGRTIAFISKRTTDKTPAVYTMTSTGTSQRRISGGSSNDSHPSWSPDGREIAYTSYIKSNYDVYRVGATGGRATLVTTSKSSDQDPAWARPATTPVPTPTRTPTATPIPVPQPTATPVPQPTATPTFAPAPTPTTAPPSGGGGTFNSAGFQVLRGFTITSTGLNASGNADTTWETYRGGELAIEVDDSSDGSDNFHTFAPAALYITDIELRGPLTVADNGSTQFLQNGAGKFTVDITGLSDESQRVASVSIEPVSISSVLLQAGDSLAYAPGPATFGTMTITFRRTLHSSGVFAWWQDFSQGQSVQERDITVSVLDRSGEIGRQWAFLEAVPIDYSFTGPGLGTGNLLGLETLVLRYSVVQFDSQNGPRIDMLQHLNSLINGEGGFRSISITEVGTDGSDGRVLTYIDTFPTRYVFPSFSSSNDNVLYEEIHLRANSLQQ